MAPRTIRQQIKKIEETLRANPALAPELQPILTQLRADLRALIEYNHPNLF